MKLAAVVISYDYSDEQLFENVKRYIDDVDLMIIWDNTPQERKKLNDEFWTNQKTKTLFLTTGKNEGIGYALNRAVECAKQYGCTHLLTMDQDSIWRDFAGYRRTVEFDNDVDIAIYAPTIADAESDFVFCCNKSDLYAITSGSILDLGVDEKVGGFNEKFFIDEVDNEYCIRAVKKGFHIKILENCYLYQHFGYKDGQSFLARQTANYSAFRTYFQVRNRLWMWRLYPKQLSWRYHARTLLMTITKRCAIILVYEKDKMNKMKAIMKACITMVTAIIVTYNPEEDLLKRQNEALRGQVDETIYVDNHSTSTNLIDSFSGDNVTVIKNPDNFGLAKAQNQGIEQAKQDGADYVILFDQDSVPPNGFVDGLMRCYQEQRVKHKVALVGPAIRNMLKGSDENEPGVVFKGLSIKRIALRAETEVSYCIASGSLIPISVLEDVGGLEEKLFIDGLDLEWCLRARSKGYRIFQTSNTYLDHCLGDGSSNRILSHSPKREYYIMRNAVWMIKQGYISVGYRLRKLCLSAGRLLQSLLAFKWEYIKSDIKGIIDGIKL